MHRFNSVFAGLALGLLGFYLGISVAALFRWMFGFEEVWERDLNVTIGYMFGLSGWLMGVGMWGRWGKEWFGLPTTPSQHDGWGRYFTFNTDHKVIGIQYGVTF